MSGDRYPVIVEYTMRHVVWVEAASSADAAEEISDTAYEWTDDATTLMSATWKTSEPDSWDWDDIEYGGDSYPGTLADAHVQRHREHLRAIEYAHSQATVDDEDREVEAGRLDPASRRTCQLCRVWREPGHEETRFHVLQAQAAARQAERRTQELTTAGGGAR